MAFDIGTKLAIQTVILLVLVVSVAFIDPRIASAQTSQQCKKEFDFAQPEAITLDWKLGSERTIEVLSDAVKTRKLKILISDIGLKDTDAKSISSTGLIDVVPQSGELTNGLLQVLLRIVRTPDVRAGTYTGRITIVAEERGSKSCLVSRQIKITVPAASLVAGNTPGATPLVETLTFWAYRSLPVGGFDFDGCFIPLKSRIAGETSAFKEGRRLGVVTKESGEIGVLYATGRSNLSDDTPGLWLEVNGLREAGTYKGKIVLDPAAGDKGIVTLTLNAADGPILPVIVIAIGVLVAMSTKIYLGVIRIRWRLHEQEADLGVHFKESQKRFENAAGSQGYGRYRIDKAFEGARRELRKAITSLSPSSGMALDENDQHYKSIRSTIATLREHSENWGRFADKLNRLQQTLRTETGDPPPPVSEKRPRLISKCESLLSGKELTLEEFVMTQEDVSQCEKEAQFWFRYNERLKRDEKLLDFVEANLANLSDAQKALVVPAREALNTARLQMWQAETEQDVSNIFAPLVGSFVASEGNILTLAGAAAKTPEEVEETNRAAMPHYVSPAPSTAGATEASLRPEPADDAEREEFFARAVKKWDYLLAFVAFVIAVLTGLNLYYFEKPFGTVKNYSELFVWAVGTKLLVDVGSVALSWLFSRAPRENGTQS